MTVYASASGGPAVVSLECPDCHAQWEAFGIVDSTGEFHPRANSDWYCCCGTRGRMKGSPEIDGPEACDKIAMEEATRPD